MRRQTASLFLLVFVSGIWSVANAEDAAPSSPVSNSNAAWTASSETIAHIRDLVAHAVGTDGVFIVNDDGSVRHIQSGLLCPPKFPNVDFWHAEVFSSSLGKGTDVGCDYGRGNPNGKAVAKLTIFATKAPEGMTLDQAFAKYRNEVLTTYPNATSRGEAIQDTTPPDQRQTHPGLRSEEFLVQIDGAPFTSQLIVEVKSGWMIEIRSSFLGKSDQIYLTKETGVQGAVLATGDRLMAAYAWPLADSSIGK
jgi:hypothetical protein